MKVITHDGRAFRLEAETDADTQLVGAIDHHRHIELLQPIRTPISAGMHRTTGYTLQIDSTSGAALAAKAQRKALSTLGDLFRLGLGQAADHTHVCALAANPQAQESLAACVVQLQLVRQALGRIVGEQQLVEVMGGTHGVSNGDGRSVTAIVRGAP